MSLYNAVSTAIRGVIANKVRASLTMLGVVIGVASVIAMLALGNGARAAVEAGFRSLGSDQVSINAKQIFDDGEIMPAGKPLTYEDGLFMVENVALVHKVKMVASGSGHIRYGRLSLDLNVSGVTAGELEDIVVQNEVQPVERSADQTLDASAFLLMGRFFTRAEVLEGARVCVLGFKTASDLFSGEDPIGAAVWINRQPCQVIGVLSELESTNPEERYTKNPNEAFYLPISTAIDILFEEAPSVSITAHVTEESQMEAAKGEIAAYLRQRHDIQPNSEGEYADDFDLTTRKDVLGSQQEAARTFALLLAAMAVVSLVVGGIGIMNVMLVSVSERTREIGVRMAVGARPSDIVAQFLLEAILISGTGGILGAAMGALTIPLAASLNQGMALLDPNSIPLALIVGVLTGVIFGMYPAARAARLDPIEALRYE